MAEESSRRPDASDDASRESYLNMRPSAWLELDDGENLPAFDRLYSEEREKARTLTNILNASRLRSGSCATLGSEDGDILHGDGDNFSSSGDAVVDIREELFQGIPEPYPHAEDYQRVIITAPSGEVDKETQDVCGMIRRALELRKKWNTGIYKRPVCYTGSACVTAQAAAGGGSGRGTNIPPSPGAPSSTPSSPAISPSGGRSRPQSTRYRRRNEPEYKPFAWYSAAAAASSSPSVPPEPEPVVRVVDGVYHVYESSAATKPMAEVPPLDEFYRDFFELLAITTSGPVRSLAYKRLRLLEARFNLHVLLNAERESAQQKSVPHRDFYNCRKVDTHIHHSACMNQKHLLRFIKHKLKKFPNEIVSFRDGHFMTLGEVFKSLHLTAYDLSVDTLDMHATNTFHRFDRFNLKYNPAGQSRLRDIFLKTDNVLAGRYLAELTEEVIADLEASKYQLAEWRVSVYGRKRSEWVKLARWFYANRLASANVRWLIQIPRLYFIYKRSGEVQNFEDMINNIFAPLFEVSRDPASNMELHLFLQTVVGFDCVDDESKQEMVLEHPRRSFPTPSEWDSNDNPPYSYWMYYLQMNLAVLNNFRASKGLTTFEFRPHCGEAGDVHHLASCYLAADQINHGIQLRKSPALQYLYYLDQIGIAMSPLSNNKLFLEYNKNPFPTYFAQGLNVSLSTDDPLMLHFTKDPLLEEYSVAAQVWKLSSTDQCEVARNSVLQSGFEHVYKSHFLGSNYWIPGAVGNDITQTNVPDIRVQFRSEILDAEKEFVATGGQGQEESK